MIDEKDKVDINSNDCMGESVDENTKTNEETKNDMKPIENNNNEVKQEDKTQKGAVNEWDKIANKINQTDKNQYQNLNRLNVDDTGVNPEAVLKRKGYGYETTDKVNTSKPVDSIMNANPMQPHVYHEQPQTHANIIQPQQPHTYQSQVNSSQPTGATVGVQTPGWNGYPVSGIPASNIYPTPAANLYQAQSMVSPAPGMMPAQSMVSPAPGMMSAQPMISPAPGMMSAQPMISPAPGMMSNLDTLVLGNDGKDNKTKDNYVESRIGFFKTTDEVTTTDRVIILILGLLSIIAMIISAALIIITINQKKIINDDTNTNNSDSNISNIIQDNKDTVENKDTSDANTVDDIVSNNTNMQNTDVENKTEEDNKTDINNIVVENNDDKLTMVFGGDVLLSDSMINSYNRNGGKITNIMAKSLLDEFVNADIAMVNEEFPFSTRGEQMQDKQYTFRTNPSYVKIFNEMGLDIVSLANNHVLDFGTDALVDTFSTLTNAKIMYVGAGNNLTEAKETKYIESDRIKVAFLSASRVIPVSSWTATSNSIGLFTTYDSTALVNEIEIAEKKADISVVYVHWGVEHDEMPQDYQVSFAKKYIDAGADVVIGCHTHCLQGMEVYKGKPIVYSMGNFMFGSNVAQTMMLKIEIDDNKDINTQVIPCYSSSYCTNIVSDKTKIKDFFEYYKGISFDVAFNDNGYIVE